MKTPERVNWQQFNDEIGIWYVDNVENGACRHCQTAIQLSVHTPLSIHALEFGAPTCAGSGMVLYANIPYCPKCEPERPGHGCLHMPYVPSIQTQRRTAAEYMVRAPFEDALDAPESQGVVIHAERLSILTPDGGPPETWYRLRDLDLHNDVAIERHFMDTMPLLIRYLERKLHGG